MSGAVPAGTVWALENPAAHIEAEGMDHVRCIEVQWLYLGRVVDVYTERTPRTSRSSIFLEDSDPLAPWQFRNILVR